VLILNVRDLLKTHAGGEPLKEVGHPKPLLNGGHPYSFAYPPGIHGSCLPSVDPCETGKVCHFGFVCRDNTKVAVSQSFDSKLESIVAKPEDSSRHENVTKVA